MMAEITATEEAARRGLQLGVVVPCMTMGPMLQQTLNFSSNHVARYLMGTKKTFPNAVAAYVDVRDVARAHLLVYERPAARGRYLCIGTVLHRANFIGMLKELFPTYPVTAQSVISPLLAWLVPDCFSNCAVPKLLYIGAKTTACQWPGPTTSPARGSRTWAWNSLPSTRVCTKR